MSRSIPITSLLLFVVVGLVQAAPVPKKIARDYQKLADETEWQFATFDYADRVATELKGYEIAFLDNDPRGASITIRISNGKEELFTWKTDPHDEYWLRSGVFYYADYSPYATGCTLTAFDLKAKKQLWKTALKGLGPIKHSKYFNAVRMEVLDGDTLRVFGKESSGRYVEFVDRGTGKTVGHKVFDEKK